MTDRTRYRVTGGVFLIAVAFIVLPMLFDGRGLAPLELPAVAPDERATATPVRPVQTSGESLVDRQVLTEAEALRQAVDEDGYLSETGTRIGDPVLTREPVRATALSDDDAASSIEVDLDGSWAVQLASFSDRANAVALRDRLRADGYQAVLSDARQGSVSSTRVAIGPIISRDDAINLQHELSDRYQLAPIVVEFSP